MTDNVFQFPGTESKESPAEFTADDALKKCLGVYKDVIIIGIANEKAQCVSTVALDEAIYELSRAIHILHRHIDVLE